MRVYSVSNVGFFPKNQRKCTNKLSCNKAESVNFQGKHTARNIGLAVGTAVSAAGFALWNLATGGVPLFISILSGVGTGAAGAFGDALDHLDDEDDEP